MSAVQAFCTGPQDAASLVPAKLVPPLLPRHWIRRARVNQKLSAATQHRLTIVTGPPGSGKTVLLADWAQEHPSGSAAWLSLEAVDNHPARFWRQVTAALTGDGTDGNLRVLDGRHQNDNRLVDLLLHRISESPPQVLIVDDFHIATDPAIRESVAYFVKYLPPHIGIVLAGQETPGFATHRLLLSGEAVCIGGRDLRFTVDEAAALLALAAGKLIDADIVRALTERSEGWAAGLHLAALALTDTDPVEFVARFSGTFRPVAEYLEHEVLQRQPPDLVTFLLETSVLKHLTAEGCRAVSGRSDAGQILASLAAHNMFIVADDTAGGGYRHHRLLADLLRSRLRLEDPSVIRQAHLKAGEWLEQCGDVRSGAFHFAKANAYDKVFALSLSSFVNSLDDGLTPDRNVDLATGLPDSYIEKEPIRMFIVAAALLCGLRVDEAARWLRRLGSVTADHEDEELWRGRIEFLWAVHAERLADASGVLDHCQAAGELMQLIARPSVGRRRAGEQGCSSLEALDTALAAQLPVLAARAQLGVGAPEEAAAILADQTVAENGGEGVGVLATLASVACRQGRLRDSHRLATEALRRAEEQGRASSLVTVDVRLTLSEVLFERDELEAAEAQLEDALGVCRLQAATHWRAAVEADLVRLMIAQQRPGEALERLGRLQQLGGCDGLPHHLMRRLAHVEISCRVALGDLEGALLVLRSIPPDERSCATLAQIDLCAGRPDRAVIRLGHGGSRQSAVEIRRLVLLGCAETQLGHDNRAEDALRHAVEVGRTEGYIRPFVEPGSQSLPLLRRMVNTSPDLYLARLLDHAGRTVSMPAQGGVTTMVEPLTDREREVLGYLPTHLYQHEIAAAMYVSINTVKTYLRCIYRKIGAATRAEAVAIARTNGLL
jgi:LuxR family maltose regulon positive regulatory protein